MMTDEQTGRDAVRAIGAEEAPCVAPDQRGTGRLSGDCHLQRAVVSGNGTLIGIVKALTRQTSLAVARFQKPGHAAGTHAEHFEPIDVIGEGERERAAAVMDRHPPSIADELDLVDDDTRTDRRRAFPRASLRSRAP